MISKKEYLEEIETLSKTLIERALENDEVSLIERAFDTIGEHPWILSPAYRRDVALRSANPGRYTKYYTYRESLALDLDTLELEIAFFAMTQDVVDHIKETVNRVFTEFK